MHICPRVVRSLAVPIVLLAGMTAKAQHDDYENPPINYSAAKVNDPLAKLARKVDSGELALPFNEKGQGYLPAVLELLDVPVSSQTLVFSKTSMQQSRISPRRPRAIYFNDDVYVGFCQHGGVIEFAATDPQQGAIFYTLKQSLKTKPLFIRDQGQCLTCHASGRTQNVPGYLIRSVYANAGGMPEYGSGTFTTDHTSPFKERWGGWYVTGTHGSMRHMGNAVFDKRDNDIDRNTHANLTTLDNLVSTEPYLTSHSDIVALMVLEHQTQMHNAITWANYETRRAVQQSVILNEALDQPKGHLSESSQRRISNAADRVLKHLLFCDEFPLASPVVGTSSFTKDFQNRGVRGSQGRSLRDFDLKTRMFRFPCSYMIHSDAFSALPDNVHSLILERLHQILEGEVDGEYAHRYSHLSKTDRKNIAQILRETKSEYAAVSEASSP